MKCNCTEIKERPIIMGVESVRAILEGRKTQTRRVINPRKYNIAGWDMPRTKVVEWCPYGSIGNRLWVRETFVDEGSFFGTLNIRTVKDPEGIESEIMYRADDNDFVWIKDDGTIDFDKKKRRCASHWKSPIFMPRWASRITLEITDIRVERVQDITENDARAEGMTSPLRYIGALRDAYIKTWNSLNAKRGYPWESNPWVWVVSFKVVKNGKTEMMKRYEAETGETLDMSILSGDATGSWYGFLDSIEAKAAAYDRLMRDGRIRDENTL